MSDDILTNEEINLLTDLGQLIVRDLECNINDKSLPCRTHRLDAVQNMREYLKIHDYKVTH